VTHETWVAEADGLREYLGHNKIVLLGHSYGGFLAQEYAVRHGEHLAGLILSDTAPALDYPDVIGANAAARGTPEQLQMVGGGLSQPYNFVEDEAFAKVWEGILPLYFHHFDPKVGAEMNARTKYSGGAFAHGFAKCLPTYNMLPRLGEIKTPTLIINGRDDWICPPAQGPERIHAAIPNSKLVILENSGHFPACAGAGAYPRCHPKLQVGHFGEQRTLPVHRGAGQVPGGGGGVYHRTAIGH
jgi:proline iminopeptidase